MADNDIAALITEIEALRAELRAALSQGQGQGGNGLGGNQTQINNPASQALGLHALTSRGFVSNLTGSRGKSGKDDYMLSGRVYDIIESKINRKLALGMSEEQMMNSILSEEVRRNDRSVYRGDPRAAPNLSFRGPGSGSSWLYRGGASDIADFSNEGIFTKGLNKLNYTISARDIRQDLMKIQPQSIFQGIFNAGDDTWRKGLSKVWKRAWGHYTGKGAIFGGLTSAFGSIKTLEREFNSEDRPQFLSQAEIRAGMSKEERFGKQYDLGEQIKDAIGSAASSAGHWAAMGMAANALQDPTTFAKARMYMAGAKGALAVQQHGMRMPGTAIFRATKGIMAGGVGLLRGMGPAAVILTTVNLLEKYFSSESDLNTWSKKNEQSNKKLKDQIDELQSIDRWTAEQRIESRLQQKGMNRSTWGTFWRGGVSLLGIVESPAEREERLRAEISEDFAQANKIAEESIRQAKLGNIAIANKSIQEARKMAGDLVTADWQDPMRIYTQQEQASRSKAAFARYLNNRVTNRTGD